MCVTINSLVYLNINSHKNTEQRETEIFQKAPSHRTDKQCKEDIEFTTEYEIKATSNFFSVRIYCRYLNLKNRKPPMTTNEKHAARSTTRNLHKILTNKSQNGRYLKIELETIQGVK